MPTATIGAAWISVKACNTEELVVSSAPIRQVRHRHAGLSLAKRTHTFFRVNADFRVREVGRDEPPTPALGGALDKGEDQEGDDQRERNVSRRLGLIEG